MDHVHFVKSLRLKFQVTHFNYITAKGQLISKQSSSKKQTKLTQDFSEEVMAQQLCFEFY